MAKEKITIVEDTTLEAINRAREPKKETLKHKSTTGMGRKSKYYTHVEPKLEYIKAWCRNGATEEEIRKKLGVGSSNWYRYKNEHGEIRDALKSKDEVDDLVENALLKRALGYKYKEIKIEKDSLGKEVVTETTKEIPPDTTAQIYWTKNRRPTQWRNLENVNMNVTSYEDTLVMLTAQKPKKEGKEAEDGTSEGIQEEDNRY